jgi:hypothetical protein
VEDQRAGGAHGGIFGLDQFNVGAEIVDGSAAGRRGDDLGNSGADQLEQESPFAVGGHDNAGHGLDGPQRDVS